MRDLESRDELTSRQIFVIAVSALAQLIDFLDFFLISFVIAMVAAPWRLTFNQSTVILLSSGIGAVIGSFVCGGGRRSLGAASRIPYDDRDFRLGNCGARVHS